MVPQISASLVSSTVCSGADQRKHQSSELWALCEGKPPLDSLHKGPVTRKCFHITTFSWHAYTKLNWLCECLNAVALLNCSSNPLWRVVPYIISSRIYKLSVLYKCLHMPALQNVNFNLQDMIFLWLTDFDVTQLRFVCQCPPHPCTIILYSIIVPEIIAWDNWDINVAVIKMDHPAHVPQRLIG